MIQHRENILSQRTITAEMATRKSLAVALSKLAVFGDAVARLEQYPTDSELAADLLWQASLDGLVEGKRVLDLGAGTGILGLGAAALGAQAVLVERDPAAAALARENAALLGVDVEIRVADVATVYEEADLVVMNPPFGTRERHADRLFLSIAFACAPIIYSFHKTSTDRFVRAFARDAGFTIAEAVPVRFPLQHAMAHHRKRREYIDVTRYRFERQKSAERRATAKQSEILTSV